MKIAIIGGGSAGMTTAYLLRHSHDVTLFEKQPILGGNIRTLNKNVTDVSLDPTITLDNGVIEFQGENFVNFHKLMAKLGVEVTEVEGGSTSLFLADGRHLYAPMVIRESKLSRLERWAEYLKLMGQVLPYRQFQRRTQDNFAGSPISDFLGDKSFHLWFKLLLMYAYSIPYHQINDFPADIAVPILRQSGLGTKWTSIKSGVYTYFERMLEQFTGTIYCNAHIQGIWRDQTGVTISLAGSGNLTFDKVIFATPPDQVLQLLLDPTEQEYTRFAAWQSNHASTIIHRDTSFYQRLGATYYSEFDLFQKDTLGHCGYNAYLNRLCGVADQTTHYGLAYNLIDWIDPAKIIHIQPHHTPLYTTEALQHRQAIIETNGENHTYHAGAYLGNGLHEGAITSALAVSQLLGGEMV